MKKFTAALLVLAMLLAVASTALAACDIKANMWVEFKKDSNSYTEAKSSKQTKNVVQKGSRAYCDKICGKYARLCVNVSANTWRWFKTADLKPTDKDWTKVVWAKGGKGMSSCQKDRIYNLPAGIKGLYVKVSGHTNLRKDPGLEHKSQGVVEKCDKLKLTGKYGYDNRGMAWLQVCVKGDKLWVSTACVALTEAQWDVLYPDWDYMMYEDF